MTTNELSMEQAHCVLWISFLLIAEDLPLSRSLTRHHHCRIHRLPHQMVHFLHFLQAVVSDVVDVVRSTSIPTDTLNN